MKLSLFYESFSRIFSKIIFEADLVGTTSPVADRNSWFFSRWFGGKLTSLPNHSLSFAILSYFGPGALVVGISDWIPMFIISPSGNMFWASKQLYFYAKKCHRKQKLFSSAYTPVLPNYVTMEARFWGNASKPILLSPV